MWPFDEEIIEDDDPNLFEFDSVASQIFEQAPDVESGLGALRDLYSEYDFVDTAPANQTLIKYSDEVRKKFGETQAFDYQTTLDFAPIDMSEIEVEAEDPEQAKLETINKWEEANLKALSETSDPIQLQAKTQLERGIKQVATLERRKFYGEDNYLVTDQALRVAQGAIDPIASLFGADSVSDWFVENTDPDGAEILGFEVGGDDSYLSAISSGAGSLAGAVGAGAVAGAPGVYGYLGASGAGQVRERVEQAIDEGASTGEAIAAGAVEGVSQAGQVLVGGKVFNRITGKLIGTPAKEFGAKIFPRIPEGLKAAGAEALTESAGQIVSNVSENIATQDDLDKDLFRGVDKAFVAGGVVAGGGFAVGSFAENYRNISEPQNNTQDFTFRDLTEEEASNSEKIENRKLWEEFNNYDGSPPPKKESIRAPIKPVNLQDYSTVANLTDETQIVESKGQLYFKKGDEVMQPFSMIQYVKPEVASKLLGITKAANADGTAITLRKEGNNLLLESEFANDSLELEPSKTGKDGIIIPGEEALEGNVPVFVNETSTQNGVRQNSFYIAEGVVKNVNNDALGAAKAGYGGQKESQYVRNLREKYGPEMSEALGLSVTQGERLSDGTVVDKQIPLMTYFPISNVESGSIASQKLAQLGPYGALDYLKGLDDRFNAEDQALINVLEQRALETYNAIPPSDINNKILAQEFLQDIILANTKIGNEAGTAMQLRTEKGRSILSGNALGDVEVTGIKTKLEKKVYDEFKKETGEDVTLTKLGLEAKQADEEVAALEKEVNDPVELEKANIDAEVEKISTDRVAKEIERPIKQYTQEIEQLDRSIETETENIKAQIAEADTLLKQEIDTTTSEISKIEKEISSQTDTTLEPTKAQLQKERAINDRINKLRDRQKQAEKRANEAPPKKATEKQYEFYEKRVAKANEDLQDIREQLDRAANDKAAIEEEIKERRVQTKGATSEQTKRLNTLKSRLTALTNQFDTIKTQDPKKSNAVKKLRSLKAERKQAIRQLNKQKKAPKELTKRQQQLLKRKEELDIAKEEGRIRIDPALKKRLVVAKTKQTEVKEKLTKVQKRLEEELSKFTPEIQNKLRNLYEIREQYQPGTEAHQALSQQINDIKTQFVENGDIDTIIRISEIVRRNRLSGHVTQLSNIGGNLTKIVGDTIGNIPGGAMKGSVDWLFYPYGVVKGLKTGAVEAWDILLGNRAGKLSTGREGKFKPQPINWKNPFSVINEVANRALSAGDSFFSRAGSVGQGYYHMYQEAERSKVPRLQRRQWVEEKMWNTAERKAQLAAQVDAEIKVLKDAGVPISSRQRTLMIYERAQSQLDAKTRAIQHRQGLKAAYVEDPEWGLGVIADGLKWLGNRTTFTIKGNIEVNPGETLFPFVRTVANVGNEMLNWTPIGFVRAAYMKTSAKNIPEQGPNSRKGYKRNDLLIDSGEVDAEGKPIQVPIANDLEIRNIFGKALVGASAVGTAVALAIKALEDDENNPWIEFYGAIPRGEYPEWRLKGKVPYSIRVGKQIFNLQNTPLAMLPVLVDSIIRGKKKGHSIDILAYNATLGSLGAVADLSFIKNVTDFVDMFRREEIDKVGGASTAISNQLKQQFANTATGFIPSVGFLNNLSKWLNGHPVETYNNLQAKLLGNIPVVGTYAGEPALNMFGDPINYNFYDKTGMSRFLNETSTDPVVLWMQESGYSFVGIPRSIKLNKSEKMDIALEAGGVDDFFGTTKEYEKALETKGEKILRDTTGYSDSLTPSQSRRMLKIAGPRIKEYLANLKEDPDFSVFNSANQEIIDKEVSKIKAEAKAVVLEWDKMGYTEEDFIP